MPVEGETGHRDEIKKCASVCFVIDSFNYSDGYWFFPKQHLFL
jgi:hypothetical protein